MSNLILGSTGILGTGIAKFDNDAIELSHDDFEIEDINSIIKHVAKYNPDIIYNCTGMSSPKECETHPEKAFINNTISVYNLAKLCREKDITLVHLSTDSVFKGDEGYYVESDIPNPVNIYGISKYAGELAIRSICDRYYIIRLAIQFGPRRNSKLGTVDRFINMLKEDKLIYASDRCISPSYSEDVARAILDIIKMDFGIYHVINKGNASIYDIVIELSNIMNSNSKIYKCSEDRFEPKLKPKSTPMKSIKIKELRDWKEALREYMNDII